MHEHLTSMQRWLVRGLEAGLSVHEIADVADGITANSLRNRLVRARRRLRRRGIRTAGTVLANQRTEVDHRLPRFAQLSACDL